MHSFLAFVSILLTILLANITNGQNLDSQTRAENILKTSSCAAGRVEDGVSIQFTVESCNFCTPNSALVFTFKWSSYSYCKAGQGKLSIYAIAESGYNQRANLTKVHEHKISKEMLGSPNPSHAVTDYAVILDPSSMVDYELKTVQCEVKCGNKLISCAQSQLPVYQV